MNRAIIANKARTGWTKHYRAREPYLVDGKYLTLHDLQFLAARSGVSICLETIRSRLRNGPRTLEHLLAPVQSSALPRRSRKRRDLEVTAAIAAVNERKRRMHHDV